MKVNKYNKIFKKKNYESMKQYNIIIYQIYYKKNNMMKKVFNFKIL